MEIQEYWGRKQERKKNHGKGKEYTDPECIAECIFVPGILFFVSQILEFYAIFYYGDLFS